MSSSEDCADIERLLSGDTAAFEGIVRRWQGPLVNLAYRFCGDRGRSEDMAQEAFLRVHRALSGWRQEAAFSTWLLALATNLYCSEIRRIPPRTVSLEDVAEPHDSRSTERLYEQADRDRVVRRAVWALPAKYGEALILFYFHDMDVAAAARSLGLPEGTLKARLSRGRAILQKKLSQQLMLPLARKEA